MSATAPMAISNSLDPARKQQFKQLTRTPTLAWPTFWMWIAVMSVYIGSDVLAVLGLISLATGMIVNCVIGYLAFSVVHDSTHRSISTHVKLNDFIGQTAVMLGTPYVNLKMFRWGHILHHRFTSGPKDPDIFLHGAWWTLPFRWMLIDVLYLIHAIKQGDRVSRPFLISSMWMALVSFSVMGALVWFGYGMHVLMLWFIPSRMIFLALGFSFFWLPHVPHDTVQEDNFTRATAIREGHEWLMGPALQYQHVHLIHHLYPMTPFYNNERLWKLIEPELRQRDLAIQHGFAIHPTIYPAPPQHSA